MSDRESFWYTGERMVNPVEKANLSIFGQEFYYEESIQAIRAFPHALESDRLRDQIADILPHPSESTRRRIASKIVQRYYRGNEDSPADLFPALINGIKSESARRDLLFWRTARTDRLIIAIACEILYPYFVLHSFPTGYDETTFNSANTATLFAVDRIVTREFAARYARERWGFDSIRTVSLALRIMRQAAILDSISVKLGRRHVLGYFPQPHSIRAEAFAYCVYEELVECESIPMPSLDRIYSGECVKAFLLSRLQVDGLLRMLERRKLIEMVTMPGGRHVRFVANNPGELVEALVRSQ